MGLVTALAVTGFLAYRALKHGFGGRPGHGRNAVIAALAVLAGGAYVVSAASSGLFEGGSSRGPAQSSAWQSLEGQTMRAGFVSGCGKEQARATAICECVFSRLVRSQRYDTPARFETLAGEIHAEQDGAAVPAELAAAVRACDAGSS